jgi:hypothetical protein
MANYGLNRDENDRAPRRHEHYVDEQLEPMDYLQALKRNHVETKRLREEKLELMEKATKAGYKNVDIARALGQTDAAIRLYRVRNGLA